jgi:hypothetical protein
MDPKTGKPTRLAIRTRCGALFIVRTALLSGRYRDSRRSYK